MIWRRINELTLEEGKCLSIIMDTPISRADIIVRYAIIILSSITVFIDTKISIISEWDNIPTIKKMGTFIFFYKAGWSLHSKRCCSPSPTSLSHCQYKDSDCYWDHQTNPHIYFTNSFKHIVNKFIPTYMGGLSVWHTPSPLKSGGPLPRIPPLIGHNVRVKRGVNPVNQIKTFLN